MAYKIIMQEMFNIFNCQKMFEEFPWFVLKVINNYCPVSLIALRNGIPLGQAGFNQTWSETLHVVFEYILKDTVLCLTECL